jgi:hypothetical protein
MAERDDAGARVHLSLEIIQTRMALVVDVEGAQRRAGACGEIAPRQHVRRVFGDADQDLVAGGNVRDTPCGGDEIERFSGAFGEHDFHRIARADE